MWTRPGLTPRDRSIVTVAALIARSQPIELRFQIALALEHRVTVAQIPFHLNRAMGNGLTQNEAAEMIAHLAFYAGWPSAMSAVMIATDVFNKRQH